ncbi:MAG: hypothetical protein WBX35_17245, partial [Pseudolabrys sp.]
ETQAISALLLLAIRSVVLRAQLDANEIKTVGIALSTGMITPEYAFNWLHDIGLVEQVIGEQVRS